jgi:hypothetical protein
MWRSQRATAVRTTRHAVTRLIPFRRGLSRFRAVKHEARAQYMRQWPRGTELGRDNALKLAVKQYIPLEQTPGEGHITFVAAHANGFPKVSFAYGMVPGRTEIDLGGLRTVIR